MHLDKVLRFSDLNNKQRAPPYYRPCHFQFARGASLNITPSHTHSPLISNPPPPPDKKVWARAWAWWHGYKRSNLRYTYTSMISAFSIVYALGKGNRNDLYKKKMKQAYQLQTNKPDFEDVLRLVNTCMSSFLTEWRRSFVFMHDITCAFRLQ